MTIVTFNSARFIGRCLQYLSEQDYEPIEIIVVDNASEDETVATVRSVQDRRIRLHQNTVNTGFAGGQNQAISLSRGEWILTLNPDVRLTPNFLSSAISSAGPDVSVGSVSGKLIAMRPDFTIPNEPVLDSTGIYFTPNLRHFDRGSREPDHGRYDLPEYVFGVTGAAGLYRRKMIEDVSIGGEFFDNDFFAYREDADLAWRAQLFGWKCLYVPEALAYHVRNVFPDDRRSVNGLVNMHSVKNRFLMRIKNATWKLYLRHIVAICIRDLLVIGGCLFREWSSLPAFIIVLKLFGRTWSKRRAIMRRRRAPESYMIPLFAGLPDSKR